MSAERYRPDIDGLRALAIIPVVFFHYRIGRFPGGFVGVDIFFVISGYLITGLLLADIAAGRFSILRFYERRARRILPALFFMLLLAAIAGSYVLLPVDLATLGRGMVATTAFVSNFAYWASAGYFERAAEFNALLHTWSLAVEEQFYILFPWLLYACCRLQRPARNAVFVLAAAGSLAASVWLARSHPSVGFFWPASRAWELLLGAFLASTRLPAPPRWLLHALSLLGLALILASIRWIDPSWRFPGWIALAPCAGAGLLLYTGEYRAGLATRFLSLRPLVFVGLISYSLYLWHWPLLVLARNLVPAGLSPLGYAVTLAAAAGLAVLSWRFVERPFRGGASRFSRREIARLSLVASFAAIAIGCALWLGKGFPARFPGLITVSERAGLDQPILPGCFSRDSRQVQKEDLCIIGADSKAQPSFVLWGDSHAQRLALPISSLAASRGLRGWLLTKGACPPLLEAGWAVPDCREFNAEVGRLIARHGEIKQVIVSALWAEYAEGNRLGSPATDAPFNRLIDLQDPDARPDNRSTFARLLLRSAARLSGGGLRFEVVGPIPEIDRQVPDALFRITRFGGAREFGPSRRDFEARQATVLGALASAAQLPRVRIVYPSERLCTDTCAVEAEGLPLYIDDNHLSLIGLERVKPTLEHLFEPPDS
jgi:peptidoglycan/LPS O-acetylase OafA/YrhL